jgi:hypothetical protein
MKYIQYKKLGYYTATIVGIASLVAIPVSAITTKTAGTGDATTGSSTTTTNQAAKAAAVAAANQARLQLIISRGNTEIDRRLVTLGTLGTKIASATKLSASDAATLNNTVATDTTALTSLKTQLDADTTVATAVSDAQSIILDYRVYALVVPQVNIVKTADEQQVAEGKLATLATKLSARITAAGQAGANITAMQASLSDLTSKVSAAQSISSNMESTVISLVPSDYNSNHSVLGGDRDQLQTAQADIQAAIKDAQSIISELPASSTKQ